MKWTVLLLAALMLAGCATTQDDPAPDAQEELRECDQISSEEECLANPACETFYRPIFEAIPGTNEYSRHDVYMNCHAKGALP